MEVFRPFLSHYANAHVQLWDYFRTRTLDALETHMKAKAAMSRPEDIAERARLVRDTFLDSIGGLPTGGPLNAQLRGVVERESYRIEKRIFESQPNVYVTSLLYVPEGLDEPAPAVLFVCGHAREAKAYPEYQRVCHDLACNGFVVLAIDPTGQGERVTYPKEGEGVGWGTAEHSYQGLQCVLTGTSIARYFLFDAMRGIDYLESCAEVDPNRIGVTGNSGGGTQTSLLCMSGDERVKAAVPCTYVTSRDHYFPTGQPQDAEQLQFAMTANGINFDDFFIPFAPRPLLIGAVESDYFPPEGTLLTYQRLGAVYRTLDCEEDVACVFGPGLHEYSTELRQAAVNWFLKHLKGEEPDFRTLEDQAIDVLPEEELWCTKSGHVLTDLPEYRTPYHLNAALVPGRVLPSEPEKLCARVVKTLGLDERGYGQGKADNAAGLFVRCIEDKEAEGVRVRSIVMTSEPGIHIAGGLLTRTCHEPTEALLVLSPCGTDDMDACLERCQEDLDAGKAVFVIDVRGVGALKPHPVNEYGDTFPASLFNTESWFAYAAYCLGESILGMRVFDVLQAARCLRALLDVRKVGLRAEGLGPSLWGYLAAAVDEWIDPIHIDGLVESFETIVRTELYRTDLTLAMTVHGILREFDLPELRRLFDGRGLEVTHASVEMSREGNA